MAEEVKGMRPIWYFVGLVLVIIGGLIFVTGIYFLFSPSESGTVLEELHPNIWWGAIMVISGGIYLWKNKDVRID